MQLDGSKVLNIVQMGSKQLTYNFIARAKVYEYVYEPRQYEGSQQNAVFC
mgnify:CR=1 FL=1